MPAISLPNLCLRWKQIYFPRFLDLLASSILCHILPSRIKLRPLLIFRHLTSCIQWLYSFFFVKQEKVVPNNLIRPHKSLGAILRESTSLSLYFEDYLNVFKYYYLYIEVVGTLLTPPNPWCHGIISHETIFAVCCAVYMTLVPFFLILSKPRVTFNWPNPTSFYHIVQIFLLGRRLRRLFGARYSLTDSGSK